MSATPQESGSDGAVEGRENQTKRRDKRVEGCGTRQAPIARCRKASRYQMCIVNRGTVLALSLIALLSMPAFATLQPLDSLPQSTASGRLIDRPALPLESRDLLEWLTRDVSSAAPATAPEGAKFRAGAAGVAPVDSDERWRLREAKSIGHIGGHTSKVSFWRVSCRGHLFWHTRLVRLPRTALEFLQPSDAWLDSNVWSIRAHSGMSRVAVTDAATSTLTTTIGGRSLKCWPTWSCSTTGFFTLGCACGITTHAQLRISSDST